VVKINPDLPLDEAALFGCAVLTGVGAVVNTAGVRAGNTVAVVGLGGVGLASILGAVASGCRAVVAVDLSPEKLALATELGATHTFVASDPDVVQKVKDATKGGVDFAIEMAGSTRAFDTAYKITRRGGTTLTAGLPPPTATWAMPSVNLVAEERTIKGSYIGTCVPSRDLPRFIDLYMLGRMPVNKLMSGKMPLAQINEGFDLLHDGKAVRQVITP
jgi:alcohol dehydrogenase